MPTTRGDPSAATSSSAWSSSATLPISRWLPRPQVTTYLTTVLPSSCRPPRHRRPDWLPKPNACGWGAADASEYESLAGIGNVVGVGVGPPAAGVHHAGPYESQSGEQPCDIGSGAGGPSDPGRRGQGGQRRSAVPAGVGGEVAGDQEAARRQPAQDPVNHLPGLVEQVQHADRDHGDGLVEVEQGTGGGVVEDAVGQAQVGLDDRGPAVAVQRPGEQFDNDRD